MRIGIVTLAFLCQSNSYTCARVISLSQGVFWIFLIVIDKKSIHFFSLCPRRVLWSPSTPRRRSLPKLLSASPQSSRPPFVPISSASSTMRLPRTIVKPTPWTAMQVNFYFKQMSHLMSSLSTTPNWERSLTDAILKLGVGVVASFFIVKSR